MNRIKTLENNCKSVLRRQQTVRRFLFDLENNENEYEQFGWTN